MNLLTFLCALLISLNSLFVFGQSGKHQFNYGALLPNAPELAARSGSSVGVQTIDLVHKDQIDILNYSKG